MEWSHGRARVTKPSPPHLKTLIKIVNITLSLGSKVIIL